MRSQEARRNTRNNSGGFLGSWPPQRSWVAAIGRAGESVPQSDKNVPYRDVFRHQDTKAAMKAEVKTIRLRTLR